MITEDKKVPEAVVSDVSPNPDVSGLVRPTHTEVTVPEPLRGVMQSNPVAKLPDTHGMKPTPPNFGSIGKFNIPIPIEQVRKQSQGSVEIGGVDSAIVTDRQKKIEELKELKPAA